MASAQQHTMQAQREQAITNACSTTSVMNSAIAGYAAGVSGVVIGHPLDSAKVCMHVHEKENCTYMS